MKIYLDLYCLFNTIMDMIILLSVSILLKRKTNIYRIVLGSLLGGIISLGVFTSINNIILEIISIIIITLIAYGYKDIRYYINNLLYTYMISILLGGIIYLFRSRVSINIYINYLIIIIISIEVVILYIKMNNKMRNIYNNSYKVDIYFKGNKVSMIGFVDTGNNLYDPYLRRPIILVDRRYYVSDKFVLVPYHSASKEGILKCIKPDKIFIEGIGYKTNLLVAFTDTPNLIEGIDVILHKDLMKGWLYVKIT